MLPALPWCPRAPLQLLLLVSLSYHVMSYNDIFFRSLSWIVFSSSHSRFLWYWPKKVPKQNKFSSTKSQITPNIKMSSFFPPSILFLENKDSVFWCALFPRSSHPGEWRQVPEKANFGLENTTFPVMGEGKWRRLFFTLWILSYLTLQFQVFI